MDGIARRKSVVNLSIQAGHKSWKNVDQGCGIREGELIELRVENPP